MSEMEPNRCVGRIWAHFRSQSVGYAALFVALGGTALAALPANSVGTKQLKAGASLNSLRHRQHAIGS